MCDGVANNRVVMCTVLSPCVNNKGHLTCTSVHLVPVSLTAVNGRVVDWLVTSDSCGAFSVIPSPVAVSSLLLDSSCNDM